MLAITALYNLTGGLKAVIYVDAVQTLIIVAGGLIVMIMGLDEVGGYDKLGFQLLVMLIAHETVII